MRPIPTSRCTASARWSSDFGGWIYDDVASDGNYGKVFVNCTHTETKGTVWTAY